MTLAACSRGITCLVVTHFCKHTAALALLPAAVPSTATSERMTSESRGMLRLPGRLRSHPLSASFTPSRAPLGSGAKPSHRAHFLNPQSPHLLQAPGVSLDDESNRSTKKAGQQTTAGCPWFRAGCSYGALPCCLGPVDVHHLPLDRCTAGCAAQAAAGAAATLERRGARHAGGSRQPAAQTARRPAQAAAQGCQRGGGGAQGGAGCGGGWLLGCWGRKVLVLGGSAVCQQSGRLDQPHRLR